MNDAYPMNDEAIDGKPEKWAETLVATPLIYSVVLRDDPSPLIPK
jgi:hypothetical protein